MIATLISYISIILAFGYFLWQLILIREWRSLKPGLLSKSPKQKVTVVIAFRNEEADLTNCLRSISHQTYPKELFQVVLVNDHSTDNSLSIASEFQKGESKLNIQLISLENNSGYGKKAALSKGIENSDHPLIVATDADCIMQENWLSEMVNAYAVSGAKMILAPVSYIASNDFLSMLQSSEAAALTLITASSTELGYPLMCNGANLAFEKEVYEEVLGYSDNQKIPSGDDTFLMLRIQDKYPGKVHFLKSERSVVLTKATNSFNDLIQQRIRWASKVKFYSNYWIIALGIMVFYLDMIIVSGLFLTPIGIFSVPFYLTIVGIRFLGDYIITNEANKFLHSKTSLLTFFPIELIHRFIAVLVAILAINGTYEWKGRKISR